MGRERCGKSFLYVRKVQLVLICEWLRERFYWIVYFSQVDISLKDFNVYSRYKELYLFSNTCCALRAPLLRTGWHALLLMHVYLGISKCNSTYWMHIYRDERAESSTNWSSGSSPNLDDVNLNVSKSILNNYGIKIWESDSDSSTLFFPSFEQVVAINKYLLPWLKETD